MENRALRHKAKRAGDYEFVRNQMKQIRPVDLRMVDITDFLVVNIDLEVHACGTYEELYWANRMKKPCIVRIAQGVEHTPDWLFGTLPFEMIFSTWDQVKTYLRHIAHDPVIDRLNRCTSSIGWASTASSQHTMASAASLCGGRRNEARPEHIQTVGSRAVSWATFSNLACFGLACAMFVHLFTHEG